MVDVCSDGVLLYEALLCRLDNVEARFQQTVDEFEQARLMARKNKSDFEKIKKERCVSSANPIFLITCHFKSLQ
jgi:hypothetical protein